MGRKPSGKPVGPPVKQVDWVQFEQLCALQCTQSEIASMLKISKEALSYKVEEHYGANYLDVYKKFMESGKCSLRRNQFVLSKKNASMAIWLGKMWLGQVDQSFDDNKKELMNGVKDAIREIRDGGRVEVSERSPLENEQSLLDQKCGGETPEV